MTYPIILDIETIPTQRQDVRDYIAATVEPPGNISKAETIAAWNAEKRPAAVEEAVNKTGLDGAFGQVVCIGYDIGGEGLTGSIASLDETFVLRSFSDMLENSVRLADQVTITIVGHNVAGFDLRFLLQRYIVNGIRPHPIIQRAAQAKPWEAEKVFCTMTQFAGVGNKISLDKLCLALGLPGKGDISGKDVWPLVQAGELEKVARYCESDVEKTRAVYQRMTFATA